MEAMYHCKLCKAILIGFRDQMMADGTYKDGLVGLMESGQERQALSVMSVQILPEIVGDKVYQLMDMKGSMMNVQIGSLIIKMFKPRTEFGLNWRFLGGQTCDFPVASYFET